MAGVRRLGAFAGVSLALSLAAAAPAAERSLDTPGRAGTIAARNRIVAYSAWDAGARRYRLRVIVGASAPRDVGVPARTVPFDVSVGRASAPRIGHADVLAFSRCRVEPLELGRQVSSMAWRTARGCSPRIMRLGGPERRVTGAGEGVLPAVSGGTIAYARVPATGTAVVIARRLGHGGAPLRTFRAPVVPGAVTTPESLALFAGRVAVVWRADTGDGSRSELELIDVRTGARTIARRLAGGGLTGVEFSGPTWLGDGSLQWAEVCGGDPQGCPHRHNYGRYDRAGHLTLLASPLSVGGYTASATVAWTLRGCATSRAQDPEAPSTCRLVAETPAPLVPHGT